jgi:Xaa-Pro aminopeptidase
MTEFEQKQGRIRSLLAERSLEALLLRRASSFAWATCGSSSCINLASTYGEAALLITPSGLHLVTNNIEAPRLEQEEQLWKQGWKFSVTPWHQAEDVIGRLSQGFRLGADGFYPGAVDLSAEVSRLRALLTPDEGTRFRTLGRLCAEGMAAATAAVWPGQTEYQIAGFLAAEMESRGVQAVVNLAATDERVFAFRHPLPTGTKLQRYAMLVLCGRRGGLVCSVTRCIHFGRLPDGLRRKAGAVAQVDATYIAATRPGETLRAILQRAIQSYAEVGFPEEWQLHHQGGAVGYEPREYLATPQADDVVSAGQAYAWNPTINGTKSEDTILVGESGHEVLTAMPGWPEHKVTVGGQVLHRPAILEIA